MGYLSTTSPHPWTPKVFDWKLFGKNLGGREGSRTGKREVRMLPQVKSRLSGVGDRRFGAWSALPNGALWGKESSVVPSYSSVTGVGHLTRELCRVAPGEGRSSAADSSLWTVSSHRRKVHGPGKAIRQGIMSSRVTFHWGLTWFPCLK